MSINIHNYDSSSYPSLGSTVGVALYDNIVNIVGIDYISSINYIEASDTFNCVLTRTINATEESNIDTAIDNFLSSYVIGELPDEVIPPIDEQLLSDHVNETNQENKFVKQSDLDAAGITISQLPSLASSPNVAHSNLYYVDKNGNDTTGTGTHSNPYLTIARAITEINGQSPSSSNRFGIIVSSGTYTESPFTIVEGVELRGHRTILIASDATNDFITVESGAAIIDCTVQGVTTVGKYCIVLSGSSTENALVRECIIGYLSSGAIKTISTVSGFKPVVSSTSIALFTETGIRVESNCSATFLDGAIIGNGTSNRGISTDGDGEITISSISIDFCSTGIYHNSTGLLKTVVSNINGTNTTPIERIGTSPMSSRASEFNGEIFISESLGGLNGAFYDTAQGSKKYRIFDELSVGLPGYGTESVFGEGDSYVNGMQVWTYDGTTFSDVTTEASSDSGSTFSFPNGNVNTAMYVSTVRTNGEGGDYLKFYNIKINQTVAYVGGEIIAEYWNGSSWTEFNHMSTEAEGEYLPYAKLIFERAQSEHIRFNDAIGNDWAKSDEVSLGISTYWIRFRIISTVTTPPTFEKIKIGTNRSEINNDGFVEYFGSARPKGTLPFDTSGFLAANNSPANFDVYLSDNLGVGRVENTFESGATDRVGMVLPFPLEIDTSIPIIAKFSFVSDTSSTNTYDFTLRHAHSRSGSTVGISTGTAPSSASTEQSIFQSVTPPGQYEQFTVTFELDISDVIPKDSLGVGDLFWMTIQRHGSTDANFGDVIMIQLEVSYTKWCNGGHE